MIATPRLLVFDWDGTLSDSSERIVACFRHALATIGAAAPTDDRTIRETIGLELPDAAAVVMPGASASRCRELTEAYRDHWLAPGAPRAKLFDEALPVLKELRARAVSLAVATGKSRRGLDREMQETGIGEFFRATRTADETRGKPHPQMLNELLATTDVAPGDALMVGDTTFDLDMATAAGVPSVAIASGTHGAQQLQAAKPVACLSRLGELLALLA